MPGPGHHRQIVSKKQNAYLHAAVARGEISAAKVHDMAMETERHGKSISELPTRIKKKSSVNYAVDMDFRRAIATGGTIQKTAGIDRNAIYTKAAGFFGDVWNWFKGSPTGSSPLTGPGTQAMSQLSQMD